MLLLLAAGLPGAASAAVDLPALRTLTPTAATTVDKVVVDPTCDTQGGTSMGIVSGSKLAGVDPVRYPVLLAMSCLDNGGSGASINRRSRVNFLDPGLDAVTGLPSGKVVKSIQTNIAGVVSRPGNGGAYLVHRPDVGDLLGCGNGGTIYGIDYSQFSSTADGTATPVPRPAGLPNNCVALGWDPEEDMIYQVISGGTGTVPNRRLDYSRAEDPVLTDINKTGFLNEASLDETVGLGLGLDPFGVDTRGPIPPFFPLTDQIAFGPTAWSIVAANATSKACPGSSCINWNRSKDKKGNPIIEEVAPVVEPLPKGAGTVTAGSLV